MKRSSWSVVHKPRCLRTSSCPLTVARFRRLFLAPLCLVLDWKETHRLTNLKCQRLLFQRFSGVEIWRRGSVRSPTCVNMVSSRLKDLEDSEKAGLCSAKL